VGETEPLRDTRTPVTAKGLATRQRILDATCDLVFERGVAGVSVDDVLEATGTSKSQLYHYFADRSDLIRSVVGRQGQRVLDLHRGVLGDVDGWQALARWRDFVVGVVSRLDCRGGCPIGSLANELAELDDVARAELETIFETWEGMIAAALRTMRANGQLRRGANVEDLAVATMASLQGGLLLAKTTRSTAPLEVALGAAIAHLRTYAPDHRRPSPTGRPKRS
jgi:TetR/AcrR family transcriptional regulator, transcriptional repressor for nem operon